jgi:hypothetical protein
MTSTSDPRPENQELRSVYTSTLADIFAQLNLSLAVSTYQAGKVILVRYDGGASDGNGQTGTLNTHFRAFQKPMGIAAQGSRLAIGGQKSVWELHTMPALARKLEPAGKHDPATCRAASTSPATSTSTRWPTPAMASWRHRHPRACASTFICLKSHAYQGKAPFQTAICR